MRLIDADAFKEKFTGQFEFMRLVIDGEPTVDKVRHGKWNSAIKMVCTYCSASSQNVFVCSACGSSTDKDTTFCPHCGASMDLD